MPDRPVEILQLPASMHELFDGLLPPAAVGTKEGRERNFLSRALSAYTIHKLSGATPSDSAASVVDGGGDGGIDAVHPSMSDQTLWLVQSKYLHSGSGEPDLGDVVKFKIGIEALLRGDFAAFAQNQAWQARIPQVQALLQSPAARVRAVLAYSGLGLVSEDRKRVFEDVRVRFARDEDDDYFEFKSINLTTINSWMTGGDQSPGVEAVELEIKFPGWVTSPYETIYGLVSLAKLAEIYAVHGKKLIAANLRGFKGRTDVNQQIGATIAAEANHFFYLNNGLTAYCERLEVNNLDRADSGRKRVKARGFSIINGAQTLGTIANAVTSATPAPEGYAFLKIISLEKCDTDREFADRITKSANLQNQIGLRDFAALYEQHAVISRTLKPSSIDYHYKIDDETPQSGPQDFNIEEALTACACLWNRADCDFVTRVAANRDSLRSLEAVYPEGELLRSRHERLFPPDMSSRTVWRAVQAQREALHVMKQNAQQSLGATKAFHVSARWVVLAAIFNRLHPERGEALALSTSEISAVATAAGVYAEKLLDLCVDRGFASRDIEPVSGRQMLIAIRDFQSVFKTQSDCQNLWAGLKSKIWEEPQGAPDFVPDER